MKKILIAILLVFSFSLWASPDDVAYEEMEGKIKLSFLDAVTGEPLGNAKVAIEEIGDYTTDSRGEVELELDFFAVEDKMYDMTVSKAKYITSKMYLKIEGGSIYTNRFSISPVMELENLRIVLDWGKNPKDLDLHLVKDDEYHISYRNMKEYRDKAKLDKDDTNGYGPETITIKKTENSANYRCFVDDFSNYGESKSKKLSKSKACVKVYVKNRLEKVFYVPESKGYSWEVFEIVNGKIRNLDSEIK